MADTNIEQRQDFLNVSPDEEIFNEISELLEGQDIPGLDEFAVLLALPDEQFEVLSELVLIELEKALMNPQDRLLLQNAMRKDGKTGLDFINVQQSLIEEIENKIKDKVSPIKLDFLKRTMTMITNVFSQIDGMAGEIVSIPIELSEGATAPTYANEGDGAMDIYALEDYTINPGETKLIKTGIKVAIPRGYALLIQPRSGQSLKTKLRVANSPGLIDSLYRGEVGVIMENIESPITDIEYKFDENGKIIINSILHGKPYVVEKGQRIAQMRLVHVPVVNWTPVNNILEIEGNRGGGFGSSGK